MYLITLETSIFNLQSYKVTLITDENLQIKIHATITPYTKSTVKSIILYVHKITWSSS